MPTCQEIHALIQQHCSANPQSRACIDAIVLCHSKGCAACPSLPPAAQADADEPGEPITAEQATDNLLKSLSDEVARLRKQLQQQQE